MVTSRRDRIILSLYAYFCSAFALSTKQKTTCEGGFLLLGRFPSWWPKPIRLFLVGIHPKRELLRVARCVRSEVAEEVTVGPV